MHHLFKLTTLGICAAMLAGCESLPGTDEQQGAVIGGAGGAAVGAVVGGEEHRVLGAILGGVLGAAGGYVVGANSDKILNKDENDAEAAGRKARTEPVTVEQARSARNADVNSDGFVTLDEVVALEQAGFTDEEMLRRLEATGHVFDLTEQGRQYLRDRGVSEEVIRQMGTLNQQRRDMLLQRLNQQR